MKQRDLDLLVQLGLVKAVEVREPRAANRHRAGMGPRGTERYEVVYQLTGKGQTLARETGATELRRRLRKTKDDRRELEREMRRVKRLRLRINLLKPR